MGVKVSARGDQGTVTSRFSVGSLEGPSDLGAGGSAVYFANIVGRNKPGVPWTFSVEVYIQGTFVAGSTESATCPM